MAAQAVPGQQFPPPNHNQAPGVAPVPDSYFTESRKGEINELRNLLKGFATERDPKKKRDIIKKVIAYMTLGIDVSRLFTEMMLAIETRDLVIKKMVYLYLTNYARTHPELAQMCTNTLQKDCGNDDPMVRGLALRALAGLGLPQMLEYIVEPVRRSLGDVHAYVRKTAVMGVLKVYQLDKSAFEEMGDPDASVVANCVIVLNEVMQHTPAGGMAINRAIMLHLLNRMHEFNEFAKVQILELVPRYIPANDEEAYQIMNLLDPVLRTTDSGATMATIKAFLSIAEQLGDPSLQRQIVARVKAPLVTQISCGSSETKYALLKHVEILTKLAPGVFDDEYRQFYVRYNEATYVKFEKVNILSCLANPDNAPDLVSELAELVLDKNTKLSRMAIQSMAQIADEKGGPGAAEAIARRLVEMLDSTHEHVSSEAALALTMLIRKNPSLKNLIAPPLVRSLKYVKDGKAAVIFLLAECGEIVTEAPYALEKLIDSYDELEDSDVKTALLTATVKLFFMRPPEVQGMLGRLLAKATADVSSQDLHDRALLYYRMLQSGAHASVVLTNSSVTGTFTEQADDYKDLIDEFNTLSIVYGKPSFKFIAEEHRVKYTKMPEEHPLEPGAPPVAPAVVTAPDPVAPVAPVPVAAAAAPEVDLLGFGGPPTVVTAAPAPPTGFALQPGVTMTGDEYQTKWEAVPDAEATVSTIPLTSLPPNTDSVEQKLKANSIQTMASGELPNEFKFYLYAQSAGDGTLFLIQSNIEKSADPLMIVTVKTFGGTGIGANELLQIITSTVN